MRFSSSTVYASLAIPDMNLRILAEYEQCQRKPFLAILANQLMRLPPQAMSLLGRAVHLAELAPLEGEVCIRIPEHE